MGMPVNPIQFSGFCFPYVPKLKCIHLPVGAFCNFFIDTNNYYIKALKAAIITTAKVFGGFNRVYGVGQVSCKIASGVIDNLSDI